ncbi:hypothetical protein BG000_004487 [Podila horticola]|nr:hypothetical protein BG000_004487 [Podila horticola]
MTAKNLFTPLIPSKDISLAFPGITKKARETVAELLEENHIKHHCFFNDSGFHNHLVHAVLANYALGASPERLRAIYKSHAVDQRPIGAVQKAFTHVNWKSELGHRDFYASYLEFFRHEVTKLGRVESIVQYAFDSDVIARTFSGAFHPLIHLGYGVDFGIDAIVAEGLAMMAVTSDMLASFVVAPVTTVEKITTQIVSHLSIHESSSPKTIVDILNALREDRELDDVTSYPARNKSMDVAQSKVAALKVQNLLKGWSIDETSQGIELKAQESYKACVLAAGAYAVSCLKSHLGATLAFYISRGRPRVDVDALINYQGKQPLDSTNPWLSILKRAVDIDEVHVTKVVRSCALGDLLFGAEGSYSQMLLNTAQIALDLEGNWEFEGVGWPETWE